MRIITKRAYDIAATTDGYRVLVDRLWPRGLRKETLALDEWCKDVAPSTELRQWFAHDPAKFAEFSARYQTELAASDTAERLLKRAKGRNLVLVYAAKDPAINHAAVLRDYLAEMLD